MRNFKSFSIFLLLVLSLIMLPRFAFPQFITAPGSSDEKYNNYSEEGYKNYSQEFLTLKRYDDFGNFLLEGLDIFSMARQNPANADDLIKYKYYTNWFENLVVAKDNYKGFSTSFIIGDAVRTKFTSLTLELARLNGIRWDGKTEKNQFTVVYSRFSDPIYMPLRSTTTVERASAPHLWNRYLFGGHWETEIGDILKFGATYVNIHQTKSKEGSEDASLKGEVTESKPEVLYLKFTDDSPEDGAGTKLYARPKIYINGQFVDMAPMNETSYPLEANGNGSFELVIPIATNITSIKSIQIGLVVANDYRIYAAHEYYESQVDLTLSKTNYQMLRQARGNVKDESNKKMELIDYSLNTGRSIYGVNFSANLFGFRINGEYNTNVLHSKFPVLIGDRVEQKSNAYFVQVKRNLGPVTFGGEYFKVDPEYLTNLTTFSRERGTMRVETSSASAVYDSGGVYDMLVDDNDDNDRYPDGALVYRGSSLDPVYEENPEEVFSTTDIRPDAGIFPGLDENNDGIPDDDQNSNGTPDYHEPFMMFYRDPPRFDYGDDWNNNDVIDVRENDQLPDHVYNRDLKGFHMFAGYQLWRGFRITGGVLRNEQMAGGGRNYIKYGKLDYDLFLPKLAEVKVYHVTKDVQDDIPDPTYQFDITELGVDFNSPKYTQDELSMRNSMVYTTYIGTNYLQIPNLNIENNVKYVLNSQRKIERWSSDDGEILLDQDEGQVNYWGIVNKIDYKFKLSEKLVLIPQFKHRWEIKYRDYEPAMHDTLYHNQWYMPIIRMDYFFTPKTVIRMGFQGFSFKAINDNLNDGDIFVYRYRDKLNPINSTNDRIFMLMATNASDYNGYKLKFNIGFQNIKRTYISEQAAYKNKSYFRFFVRVLAGW